MGWLVDGNKKLKDWQIQLIQKNERIGIGISAISCWEVAKLVEIGRLKFKCSIEEWMSDSLKYPGIHLLELTPQISIESCNLPDNFHKDPADQIIVATARSYDLFLLTSDIEILNYSYVKTFKEEGTC